MSLYFDQMLNIRQKLFFAFTAFMLSTGALGVISFYNHSQIEEKITLVESAYELSNIVLEIRRYEKNYFLYVREEDYQETNRFIHEAIDLLHIIRPTIKNANQVAQIQTFTDKLFYYSSLFNDIHTNSANPFEIEIQKKRVLLRNTGQQLVGISHEFVIYEKELVLKINDRLKQNTIITTSMIYGLSILIIAFIILKVIKPLKIIEQTTRNIAQGNFEKVHIWNTNDEIQRVMIAFNKMVAELEKRQDQLVQAQKLSSIGTLASGIAHQVNNPLNNISTSCQILMEDFKDSCSDLALKMMTNIEKETFRARDIVRCLLEFSRHQEFVLKEYRLIDIIDRSLKLISSQVPSGIEIITQVPAEIILDLDAQRMQEVFINLLMNAVHAIRPDSGKISIIATKDEETRTLTIHVEDTGRGVPEEIRTRIFDPFFSTKDVGDGTGLGLYLTYGIIQQHNGSIHLGSMMRGGTQFIIKLPLRQPQPGNGR